MVTDKITCVNKIIFVYSYIIGTGIVEVWEGRTGWGGGLGAGGQRMKGRMGCMRADFKLHIPFT